MADINALNEGPEMGAAPAQRAGKPFHLNGLWRASSGFVWKIIIVLMTLTALYVVSRVLHMTDTLQADQEVTDAYVFQAQWANSLLLIVHAATALIALVVGPICFSAKRRKASLREHRRVGQAYVIGIMISSITGIMLATANQAGPGAQWGFGLLGVFWFGTTLMAYMRARDKRIPDHRVWMIRSYALTLAVVTVRPLFLFPPDETVIAPDQWYIMVSWLCWVPNLILGELYIALTTFKNDLKWRSQSR